MLAGVRVVSPSPEAVPVATVLVPAPTPKATIQGHKLLDSLVTKFPLNTFSTPNPTPVETSAPSVPTLKELLLHVSCVNFITNVQDLRNAYASGLYAAAGVLSELCRMQAMMGYVYEHHSMYHSQLSNPFSMQTYCSKFYECAVPTAQALLLYSYTNPISACTLPHKWHA